MENEKPDLEEKFEPVSDLGFSLEFNLQSNALNDLTDEEANAQIAEGLKSKFETFNPFEEPETTITVEINELEVCKNSKTGEIDGTGELCETSSRRKRRSKVGKFFKDNIIDPVVEKGENFYKKTKEPVVTVLMEFQSLGEEAYQWSEKRAKKFAKSIKDTAKKVAEKVKDVGRNVINNILQNFCEKNDLLAPLLSQLIYKEPKDGLVKISVTQTPNKKTFQLHNWMFYLDEHMKEIPLTMLAIPGTHDSATHVMDTKHMSYDSPIFTDKSILKHAAGNFNGLIAAWGKCVKHNIKEQLQIGIRYFDFR